MQIIKLMKPDEQIGAESSKHMALLEGKCAKHDPEWGAQRREGEGCETGDHRRASLGEWGSPEMTVPSGPFLPLPDRLSHTPS